MKIHAVATASCLCLLPVLAAAHAEDDAAQKAALGSVRFPTSCDSKVQVLFERGVAMLHSYWFREAAKTFTAVLEQDPACAIAHWGRALTLMGNPLLAPPPPKDLAAASEAILAGRSIGAKTQRERDWI